MIILPEMYENLKGILVYTLDGKEFCCDLHSVVNVIKLEEALDEKKKIIINNQTVLYNGAAYRLIDLHKIFWFREFEFKDATRLVLLDVYTKKIAFFVEMIVEIFTIENMLIDNSIEIQPCMSKYWKYILTYNNKGMVWPDFEKICKDLNTLPGININQAKAITEFQ